jgi:hypothetical protein
MRRMSMKKMVFVQIPVEASADTYENIGGLIEYLEQGFEIISAVGTAGSVQYILNKDVTPTQS